MKKKVAAKILDVLIKDMKELCNGAGDGNFWNIMGAQDKEEIQDFKEYWIKLIQKTYRKEMGHVK